MNSILVFTRGTAPALDAIVSGAVDDFNGQQCRLACRHVVDGAPVIFLCVQHPAAGIQCVGCTGRHLRRHDLTAERTCDACGDITPADANAMHGLTTVAHAVGTTVSDTRSRRVQIHQRILLIGAGVCHGCYIAIEGVA